MATPWVILGRYLRVGLVSGDVEAEEAQAEQAAAGLDAEAQAVALQEQVAATMDAVDAEAQAGLVAPVDAGEEAQAEDVDGKAEHAAAAADFRLSVALPPRVTVIAAGRGAHPDPESPDICPYVVAVSPQFLLVHFTGPFFFGTHFTHHLVLVRDLHHGQTTYCATRVPERADGVPTLWQLENVALHSNTNGDYTIAELQVHRRSRTATLVYLRSGGNGWRVNHMPYPLPSEDREWTPHGAISVDTAFWWFDLSWGILSYGASLGEAGLIFHHLPGCRTLTAATPRIHTKRCVTASHNKLRYLEITNEGEAAKVCMWSRSRGSGPNGWKWDARYAVSFEEIWDDGSYKETGLPRYVPMLSVVCPSNPDLVYFALEQRLFGVDVPARRVVHNEAYALVAVPGPPRPPSGRYVVAWDPQPVVSPVGMLEASTSYQPAYSRAPASRMIAPSLFGECSAVYDVWAETAQDAFIVITALLHGDSEVDYMIGIDSEFAIPDGVVSLGREPPSANVHYEELCKMVNGGNLVQVGFAVADANFNVLGVWQFNLQFQSSWRAPWHAGVAFLRDEAKLKLEEHASHGIPAAQFIDWLASSAMIRNPKITWISFMGYPDFGFLIRLLTRQEALPGDRVQFLNLFWELFPRSFDVRVFTKLGRCRKEVIHGGLAKVCETLQVERVGDAHHAGSDALLAVRCFHKMMTDSADFATQIPRYCGVLYGVVVDCW